MHATYQEAISAFVARLDDAAKRELNRHLTELRSSGMGERELEDLWIRRGAEVWFDNLSMQDFFMEVQQHLSTANND